MRAQSSPLVVFSTKMNGWLFTPWTLQCIRRDQPSVRGMLCSQSGRLNEEAERHDVRLVCILSPAMVCTLKSRDEMKQTRGGRNS